MNALRLLTLPCLVAISTGVLVSAGCSNATEGTTQEPVVSESDPGGAESSATEATPEPSAPTAPTPTPIDELTVNTAVSDPGPSAGQLVEVTCNVEGLAVSQDAPETHWELYSQPDELLHEPEIDGDVLTLKSAGEYQVRCILTETSWIDPTPAKIHVHPSAALSVETTVEPDLLAAGTTGVVLCEGEDEYGNIIEDQWDILVAPGGSDPGIEGGLLEANGIVKGVTVGTYEVTCAQFDGTIDESPAGVTVEHGQPYRIVAILGDDQIVAGHTTSLTCRAEDKWGNLVPDLPMAVDMPANLTLQGLSVTGTITGKYAVKCVPQALDWTLFVLDPAILEVLPDVPVALEAELSPPKPFFATYELMQVLVTARDQYDNPVPDAVVAPLEVDADPFLWKETQPLALLFKEEGIFTITVSLEDWPSIDTTIEVHIDGAPPSITVTHPLRGATVQNSKPSVTIEGLANDTITEVISVTVNGQEADIHDDGTWTLIMIPKWGLNVIEVIATDEQGLETAVLQSFYFAELYWPMDPQPETVPDSIKTWLDDKFIDDGDHNPTHPDDLATILEMTAAGLDLGAALGASNGTDVGLGYELQLKSVTFNPPQLNLLPMYGGLHLNMKVKNLKIDLELEAECKVLGIDLCPDFGGSAGAGVIIMDVDMLASAKNGQTTLAIVNPQIELQALDVDIDGILGWLFDWLIDFVVNIFAGTIEDLIEDQVGAMFDDILQELTEALEITETLELDAPLPGMDPISLTLETGIWSLNFTPEGGRLGLGARTLSTKKVPQTIHGAISRGTCVKGYPTGWQVPGESAFEVGLLDDFANLLLTTVWYQGILNLELDSETIAELMGEGAGADSPLPFDDLALETQMMLPPILNGCDPDGLLLLELGDAYVQIDIVSPLFGGQGTIGVFLSVVASAEILLTETDEGPAIALQFYGIDEMHYSWELVPELFEGNEEALEILIEQELLGAILEDMTGTPLIEIPIPEIDLYDLSPLFGQGVVIDPAIEDLLREGGHTLIQGYLE